MDPENKSSQDVYIELIESLLWNSVLLREETKAGIRAWAGRATGDELSRAVAFLSREKSYIVEFMRRRLHDGTFPEKVPILLGEMRAGFTAGLRAEEAKILTIEREQSLAELSLVF